MKHRKGEQQKWIEYNKNLLLQQESKTNIFYNLFQIDFTNVHHSSKFLFEYIFAT